MHNYFFAGLNLAQYKLKLFISGLALILFACVLVSPVHAQTQDFEALNQTEPALPDPLDASGWEVVSQEAGVTISTRNWPGSDFYAIKIEQVYDSSLSNVVAHLLDETHFKDWIPDLKSAHIIRQLDEQQTRSVYLQMAMPWPLDDRDSVIGQRFTQDPETLVVRIKEWNEGLSLPEKQGVVRAPRINSEYVLIPLADEKVRSIWQGHQEPGGAIPSVIANWMIENIYLESAKKMRTQFENKAQIESVVWIKNPVE